MLYDSEIQPPLVAPRDDEDASPSVVPAVAPLPPGLVMTERAAGLLRQYLDRHRLEHYHILHCEDLDLEDAERYLEALGESAQWQPLASALTGGAVVDALTHGTTGAKI